MITNFRDYVFQNNRVVETLLLFVCDLLYRGQEKRMRENNYRNHNSVVVFLKADWDASG